MRVWWQTQILDGGGGGGRSLISILPLHHVCCYAKLISNGLRSGYLVGEFLCGRGNIHTIGQWNHRVDPVLILVQASD